jgi:hypothetical protein
MQGVFCLPRTLRPALVIRESDSAVSNPAHTRIGLQDACAKFTLNCFRFSNGRVVRSGLRLMEIATYVLPVVSAVLVCDRGRGTRAGNKLATMVRTEIIR